MYKSQVLINDIHSLSEHSNNNGIIMKEVIIKQIMQNAKYIKYCLKYILF